MAIPRGAVRGVSFDYGHVLGTIDLDELARRIGLHGFCAAPALLDAGMADAYRAHDAAIARGEGHEAGWLALMGALVRAGTGSEDDVHTACIANALWAQQPESNLWRQVPDEARALARDLEAHGVPMVITSNSEGRLAELAQTANIAAHFRAILDSGRLGFAKPDARIFDLARRSDRKSVV